MSIKHQLLRASGESQIACQVIDKQDPFGDGSCKAFYRFDGNANDELGNYHGTEAAVTYGGGAYGRGAVFNGTSSYINLGSTVDDMLRTASAFTISAWINPSSYATDTSTIFYLLDNIYLRLHLDATGKLVLQALNSSGTDFIITDTVSIATGQWSSVVATGDSSGIRLYKNGAQVGSTLAWNGTFYSYADASYKSNRIGASLDVSSTRFEFIGLIDQVRIFNRAVTAAEAATLYYECAPASIVDDINPFMDGSLKAMYKFDGDTTDATGMYNGTATNVTYGTGKFGQCAVFNGSSSFVNSAISSTIFSSWTSGFSISMMVSFASATATYGLFNENVFGNTAIEITKVNGSTTFRMYLTGGTTAIFSMGPSFTYTVNKFYHLVCLWDGKVGTNNVKMYINGTLVGQTSAVYPISSIAPFSGIHIGRRSDGYYLNGSIEQLRIFNKALTPMEVASLYNETTPLEEPMSTLVDPFRDFSGKALYRLEGNALDESGNYNGTPTSVTYGAGQFGRCGVFNGSSSVVALPTFSADSFSFWVKATNFTSGPVLYEGRLTGCSGAYIALSTAGQIQFATSVSAGVNTGVFIDTNWNHIAVTYDGTTYRMFKNATLSYSVASARGTGRATQLIGAYEIANSLYRLTGSIDQVRFFNRALTAGEVSKLYTGENNVL